MLIVSTILLIMLLDAVIRLLREDKTRERRVATQRDLPRELLLPRHYKSFVEIERKLWAATADSKRGAGWDRMKIKLPAVELEVVREYVRGLRQDFAKANRIFGVVVSHSQDEQVLKQIEMRRIKLEFQYHTSLVLVRFRLRMHRVSPWELQRLTQAVATMAYEVRSMVQVLESQGRGEFVETLLREY
jgi:hypothetical protein